MSIHPLGAHGHSAIQGPAEPTDSVVQTVAEFPAMRGRALFRVLSRAPLGYTVARQSGSHRILVADDRPNILFAFHDRAEISPRVVRKILCSDVGLTEAQALELL